MTRSWLAGATAALALGATVAQAQDRGPAAPGEGPRAARHELSQADREALGDARIAALRAGLKLTPDQEKLWPPMEAALRNLARQRTETREARRERFASLRESRDKGMPIDVPAQLRFTADRQAASADALRKVADAAAPLYGQLDEAQKRRFATLGRGFMRDGPHRGPHAGR